MQFGVISIWLSLVLLAIMVWWFLPELLIAVLTPVMRFNQYMLDRWEKWEKWLIAKRDYAQAELKKLEEEKARETNK